MIEVKEVLVLDYEPSAEAGKGINCCQRCKWAPAEYKSSSLKNNLWSAPCVTRAAHVDDLTADRLIWQIFGGAKSDGPQWVDGTAGMDGCGCLDALPKFNLPETLWVEGDDE